MGQAQVYEAHLGRLSRILSSWPLQFLLSAPTLGLIVWTCAQTVLGFFTQHYLPPDYFRHAAIATLTVWVVSFVLLQAIVVLALRRSLRSGVARALADSSAGVLLGPLQEQLRALQAFHRSLSSMSRRRD